MEQVREECDGKLFVWNQNIFVKLILDFPFFIPSFDSNEFCFFFTHRKKLNTEKSEK